MQFLVVLLLGGYLCSGSVTFGVIGDWGYITKPTNIKKMMKRID